MFSLDHTLLPTQGNNTHFVGNSKTIGEQKASNSTMDTVSLEVNTMSRNNSFRFRAVLSKDMHARPQCSINSPVFNTNPFTNGREYNKKLRYIGVNAYGVHVYVDPLSMYLIKTVESLTLVQEDDKEISTWERMALALR